ncbi:hypothetical protein ACPSKX_04935 [Moritella viscosa]
MFFNDLRRFKNNIALIDAKSGEQITYCEIDEQVDILAKKLGFHKELVFIESRNTIKSVICYLACLRSNKVIYLADDFESEKSAQLINYYQPNLLIDASGHIHHHSHLVYLLHTDLTLLLSTSGTTGTPKSYITLMVYQFYIHIYKLAHALCLVRKVYWIRSFGMI